LRKEARNLGIIAILVVATAAAGMWMYNRTQTERREAAALDNTLVRPDSPTLGPANAPVTIVEFLDPECEACAAFSPVVKRIMQENPGKIRLVVRYMSFHPNSLLAAAYNEAAGEQGKYWEMQELLFQRQHEWADLHGQPAAFERPPARASFDHYASSLQLDMGKLRDSVTETRHRDKVVRDMRDGQNLGVTKTPTFFVNGKMLMRFSEADLRALIAEEMKGK